MAETTQNPNVKPWVISPEEEQAFRAGDSSFTWPCTLPSGYLRKYSGKWTR
jgi:hypothetical protein